MLKKLRGAVALSFAFILAFGSAGAGAMPRDAVEAWNAVKGPAAASIFNLAKRKHVGCYTLEEGQKTCVLANIAYLVEDLYSDDGPWPEYAIAVIHATVDTGNVDYFITYVFRRNGRSAYDFVSAEHGSVGNPVSVKLENGVLVMTTKTLRKNDAHCCPTGRTIWRVDPATGKARYLAGNR